MVLRPVGCRSLCHRAERVFLEKSLILLDRFPGAWSPWIRVGSAGLSDSDSGCSRATSRSIPVRLFRMEHFPLHAYNPPFALRPFHWCP